MEASANGAQPPVPNRTPPNCEACGAAPQIPAMLTMQVGAASMTPLAGPNGSPLTPRIDGSVLFRPPILCPPCRRALCELVLSTVQLAARPDQAGEGPASG